MLKFHTALFEYVLRLSHPGPNGPPLSASQERNIDVLLTYLDLLIQVVPKLQAQACTRRQSRAYKDSVSKVLPLSMRDCIITLNKFWMNADRA